MAQDVGLGQRSYVGVGEESTYATAVAPTQFFEILSEGFGKSVARIESSSIISRSFRNTKTASGMISVAGDMEFEACYDGWMKIAKHAFGAVSTTQPDVTNAPTAYNHQFTITDTPLTGLTVQVFRDSSQFVTEPNKAFQYAGCKVNSLELACGVDEILKVRAGLIGQNEARVAKVTDSYSTARVAIYHQGIVTWNNNDIQVSNFSIALNNGYGQRPKLGSQFSREPVFTEKMTVTGSFTMEFGSWDQYDDFCNTTERQMVATFLGDTIGGSIKQMIKLTCPVSLLHNVRVALNSPGRIMLEADFKCYRSTSTNELTLDIRNTSSSA